MSSDSTNAHTMELPSSVTMDVVEELFAEMKQLKLDSFESFTLDASKVTTITTPGVQLIVSLDRSLKEQNVKLSLINPTENFSQTFQLLGLGSTLSGWSIL